MKQESETERKARLDKSAKQLKELERRHDLYQLSQGHMSR